MNSPTYEELEQEIQRLKEHSALLKRANKGLGSNLAWRVKGLASTVQWRTVNHSAPSAAGWNELGTGDFSMTIGTSCFNAGRVQPDIRRKIEGEDCEMKK